MVEIKIVQVAFSSSLTEYFEESYISIQTLSTLSISKTRLLNWSLLLWLPFFPSTSTLFLFHFNFLFILQSEFIDDFLIFHKDARLYFLLSISIETKSWKDLTASGVTFTSVGWLVWLEEVRMAWFISVLGLWISRGVTELDPRVLEAEVVMIAAELVPEVVMTDAEQGPACITILIRKFNKIEKIKY